MWYIYSVEYYSAVKRTNYCPGNRINNKCFILSKRSQSPNMIYCVVPLKKIFLEKVKLDNFLRFSDHIKAN